MGEKKIHKLNLQKSFSFQIVGIVSHEQIFILTNEISRFTNIQMDELVSLRIVQNDVMKCFNAYNSIPDENDIMFSLISNRSSEGFLEESHKSLDYFLVLSSENQISIENTLIKKIKGLKQILAISVLEINTIKQKKFFESVVSQLRT